MGSREDPALMMDPANCLPVQVAGTCQKDPPSHCLSGWQLYVTTQRPNGGESHTCSRAGLLIWLLACPPPSSWDVKAWIDVQLWNSQGCSSHSQKRTWAEPGTDVPPELDVAAYATSVPIAWSSGLLEWFWSQHSGQVRCSPHLMEADGFPGACHSRIISSDGKSVWFG